MRRASTPLLPLLSPIMTRVRAREERPDRLVSCTPLRRAPYAELRSEPPLFLLRQAAGHDLEETSVQINVAQGWQSGFQATAESASTGLLWFQLRTGPYCIEGGPSLRRACR